MKPPTLSFDQVTIEADPLFESSLCNLNFELKAGELMLILLDREHLLIPLADAACGLLSPSHGRVRFMGLDWQELSVHSAARQRGRINRLFPVVESWVNNLDLEDNVLLAQRHHTRRPEAELWEEAARLATDFLLPGLPLGKPEGCRRQDLQKAACVRAFMGRPDLILLERPTIDIQADVMAPLVNAIHIARSRGSAVLWTTEEPEVWEDPGLRPSLRGLIAGAKLHLCNAHGKTLSDPACE